MGRIDHVKIVNTTSNINNDESQQVAHFPVHIQFFFNLPQSRRFKPRSNHIAYTSTESPISNEILLPNSLEISLITRATNNTLIQKQLTDNFLIFNSLSLHRIEIYTDGSLAENKSSGTYEMGSGWVSLDNNCSFICNTTTWPSSTRAELLAIYTALLVSPTNRTIIIKTDSQAAIDGITKSYSYDAHNKWLSASNRTLLRNIDYITKFKSLNVEYVKIKAHSGIEGNEIADSLANQGRRGPHFDTNFGIFPKATFSPHWNNISIEMPIRKFIKELNQTYHQASWSINRPIRDFQLHRNRFNPIAGFTNLAIHKNIRCNNWKHHNAWSFGTKLMNDITPTIDLLHSRDPTYFNNINCFFCNQTQESIEHLTTCPALSAKWHPSHPQSLTLPTN